MGEDAAARSPLDLAFHPRSIAVAGVSPRRKANFNGKRWFDLIRRYGIVERVYAINPRGGSLDDGAPLYPSLRDVPDDAIDLLISAIPVTGVLDLLDQAAAKGIRVMHLLTAGFGETGLAGGAQLEAELLRRAQAHGIRLIGPNCMGLHTPIGGVSWLEEADVQPGSVAMLSQSGANASEVVMRAVPRAVRFSYVASYGNALDLNEGDFLEYFADDPDTDIVLAYLEGIRDGRRFLPLARRLASRKPFVVLKGGMTEAGGRAAANHTGSLAGSAAIWQAVTRQTGLIDVTENDQLLDLAVTAQRLAGVKGPRAALVGRGGGHSVLAADALVRAGLELPPLAGETQERLRGYLQPAGNSIRNPVDSDVAWDSEAFVPALQVVATDPKIDVVILMVNVDNLPTGGSAADDGFERGISGRLLEARDAIATPLAIVLRAPRTAAGLDLGIRLQRILGDAGIAVYDSVGACSGALRRYLNWRSMPREERDE